MPIPTKSPRKKQLLSDASDMFGKGAQKTEDAEQTASASGSSAPGCCDPQHRQPMFRFWRSVKYEEVFLPCSTDCCLKAG